MKFRFISSDKNFEDRLFETIILFLVTGLASAVLFSSWFIISSLWKIGHNYYEWLWQ